MTNNKVTRSDFETILWDLEEASYQCGLQGGKDLDVIRKDNVIHASERLINLHQQEMLKALPSKIDNWTDVASKVAFKNIPMTNHNASRWRQGYNAAIEEVRTNLSNSKERDSE